jgi:hypothetical protein
LLGNYRSNALSNHFLAVVFGSVSFVMLFQSYKPILPLTIYILLVIFFISAIIFAILFGKELTAAIGIFSFSIVIRLMYYVSTGFSVLPYGDPYGQYTVLQAFSETSRITIFSSSSFLNFLTRIPHQYSEWPGFESFSLGFSRITNLSTFWTALIIPFILYGVWFVVSYAIVRNIFAKFVRMSSTLSLLTMAVAIALPTFELPPIFKYDFMAAVLLLAVILLLILSYGREILGMSLLFVLLISAIAVTHSLTALFLVILVVLLGIGFVIRAVIPMLSLRLNGVWIFKGRSNGVGFRHNSFPRIIVLVLSCVAAWWAYYSTFILAYASKGSQFLLSSFSLQFLSFSRIGARKASVITDLTPHWLIQLLSYRDELLLGLVTLGAIILVIKPTIVGRRLLVAGTLLSIGSVTLITEALRTLNFGDRAFLTFAPILACFVIMPVAALAYWKPNLAKVGGILIVFIFLFSVALGFWGSGYAPVYLYSKSASAYAFGEHPTNWQQVANYMNYGAFATNSSNPSCILTNEIYVTSLVVPVKELGITYPFTDIRVRSGCLVIIYDSLLHFNYSAVSEPYFPYSNSSFLPGFSDAAFSNTVANKSDLVFDGGNTSIYYVY